MLIHPVGNEAGTALSLANFRTLVSTHLPVLSNNLAIDKSFACSQTVGDGQEPCVLRLKFAELLKNLFTTAIRLLKPGYEDVSEREAPAAFKQADKNGNGFIDFDEFCAWASDKLLPLLAGVKVSDDSTESTCPGTNGNHFFLKAMLLNLCVCVSPCVRAYVCLYVCFFV
jgi:hypothetical protein